MDDGVSGLASLRQGGLLGAQAVKETPDQEIEMRQTGCGYGRGFLYSKAIPASRVTAYLRGEPEEDGAWLSA